MAMVVDVAATASQVMAADWVAGEMMAVAALARAAEASASAVGLATAVVAAWVEERVEVDSVAEVASTAVASVAAVQMVARRGICTAYAPVAF